MRYVITTPEPRWTGEVAGVAFAFGRGVTDDNPPPRVINYFLRRGYGVEPVKAAPSPAAEVSAPAADGPADRDPMPRKSASKADWQTYAIAHGVPADEAESLTRDQLAERFATEGADQ